MPTIKRGLPGDVYSQERTYYAPPKPINQPINNYNVQPGMPGSSLNQQSKPSASKGYGSHIKAILFSRISLAVICAVILLVAAFVIVIKSYETPESDETRKIISRPPREEDEGSAPNWQELVKQLSQSIRFNRIELASIVYQNMSYLPHGNTFSPGEQVYIYAEIRGLKRIENPEGFNIAFIQSVELRDSRGRIIESHTSDNIARASYNMSEDKDYVVPFGLSLATDELDADRYNLTINVEDVNSGKVANGSIGFGLISD